MFNDSIIVSNKDDVNNLVDAELSENEVKVLKFKIEGKRMKKTLAVILSSMFLLTIVAGDSFAARSSKSYKPKTVKVKSYNRKSGSNVRSHYRSK